MLVQIRELNIPDSFEVTPVELVDSRGSFFEWYRFDVLSEAVGHPLDLRQANMSVSHRGVFRGIHFADIPRGQAKYVTAVRGTVLDFVIDIRVGSPTYGQWDSVELSETSRNAVYIAEGLGHAFLSLTDGATVAYLVSDTFKAEREHGINPLDKDIDLKFPLELSELLISPKDSIAPSLDELARLNQLPTWDLAQDYYAELNESSK